MTAVVALPRETCGNCQRHVPLTQRCAPCQHRLCPTCWGPTWLALRCQDCAADRTRSMANHPTSRAQLRVVR